MAIPESQLITWTHQGAVTTAKSTADSIKNALDIYTGWPDEIELEVYLQGSYKNDTNIRGDSDVDVVVELTSTFYSNLTEDQKRALNLDSASYGWSDFRRNVLDAIKNYYGQNAIVEGSKTLKVPANNGRLPADVVVCSQYKKYNTVNHMDNIRGMCFWTEGRQIVNYPKIHTKNTTSKHQSSSDWYKPTVRMFKNMRSSIQNDATASYFLECLIYNVPVPKFGTSYQDTFCNAINWLNQTDLTGFKCPNGQHRLFGGTPEQWDTTSAQNFIANAISVWNNW